MPTYAFDPFTFAANNSIAGHVAQTGQTWSVNIDLGHFGDVINYSGVKVGSTTAGANGSTAAFVLPVNLPSADYSIRTNFLAGVSPAAKESVALLGRLQQTSVSATLDYYCAKYSSNTGKWQLTVRYDSGGFFNLVQSAGVVLTPGQNYVLDLTMTGTSIVVSVDGVAVITHTDSHITGIGNPGIQAPDCAGTITATDNWWMQDYLVYVGSPSPFTNSTTIVSVWGP